MRSQATSPTTPGVRTLLAPRVAPTQPALSVAVQETDTGSDVSTKNLVTTPTKFPGVKDKEVRFDISQEKNKKNTKGEGRQEDVTRGGQGHKLTRQDAEDKLTNSDLFEPDTLTSQKEPVEKVTTGQSTHGTTEPLTTVDKLTEEEVGKLTLEERAEREIIMAEQKMKASGGGAGSVGGSDVDLLSSYADQRSKVNVTGTESRVELMEKVLDMDDEISDMLKDLRKKEEERKDLEREVITLREHMLKDLRKKEEERK